MLEAYIIERVRKDKEPTRERPTLRISENQLHQPENRNSVKKQSHRGIEVIDFTI